MASSQEIETKRKEDSKEAKDLKEVNEVDSKAKVGLVEAKGGDDPKLIKI